MNLDFQSVNVRHTDSVLYIYIYNICLSIAYLGVQVAEVEAGLSDDKRVRIRIQ